MTKKRLVPGLPHVTEELLGREAVKRKIAQTHDILTEVQGRRVEAANEAAQALEIEEELQRKIAVAKRGPSRTEKEMAREIIASARKFGIDVKKGTTLLKLMTEIQRKCMVLRSIPEEELRGRSWPEVLKLIEAREGQIRKRKELDAFWREISER